MESPEFDKRVQRVNKLDLKLFPKGQLGAKQTGQCFYGLSKMEAAGKVLKRAVELDNQEKFSEALVCYQEGIDILFNAVKQSTDDKFRANARQRLTEYMSRAETLKEFVQNQKEAGKYHEKIEIKAGQKGCSYAKLFSKYIDEKLTKVIINDPYIRSHHQILNLLRFCELLVKKGKKLQSIKLTTTGKFWKILL